MIDELSSDHEDACFSNDSFPHDRQNNIQTFKPRVKKKKVKYISLTCE